MHRTLSLTTAILAIATAASAQDVQATLTTAEAVGVHANRQIDAARAGTAITRALRLSASDDHGARSSSFAAPAAVRNDRGHAPGASFAWSALAGAGATAGTLGGNPLSAGAQHYSLELRTRGSVSGTLHMVIHGRAHRAEAGALVQVGDQSRRLPVGDGHPQRASIPGVTVNARGVTASILIVGAAAGGDRGVASYGAGLRVWFSADDGGGGGCHVQPGQRSCPAGGVLHGALGGDRGRHQLGLALTGALADAIGVTLVSAGPETFPIGDTHCIFFTRPIVAELFRTDAHGNARTSLTFPDRRGARFYVQQGTIKISPHGVEVGTSNTLEVSCR